MSHACTLSVNGIAYPLELDAGRTLLTVLRGELGSPAPRRAATTPSAAPAWCWSTAVR